MAFVPRITDEKSAFGELVVAELTPLVQVQFPYNINARLLDSRENQSGTVTEAGSMAVLQSGAAANSSAMMLSRQKLVYAPGQGALTRYTALFTTGVANSTQTAGIGDQEDGFFFGYNGADFGVLRRHDGKSEIQTLTVSAGAGTGSGDITINLNSQAKTVAVTVSDTAREVAVKIANTDFSDVGGGWDATVHNATVIFKYWDSGDLAGTFSLVDTDTTGSAGTFAETVAGVSATDAWVAQASWSLDPMDGTGSSGVTVDPTKGNVFQIRYQWLGFGSITFSCENPETGELVDVHRIEYGNTNTTPSIQNPSLSLCVGSRNTSNTSNLTVKTASMSGFVEGRVIHNGPIDAVVGSNAAVATTELPLVSLKNPVVYLSLDNRVPLKTLAMSVASDGTKSIIVRVRLNATLTGTPAFSDVSTGVSVAMVDTAATGITGGALLLEIVLAKVDNIFIDLIPYSFILEPSDAMTITAEATGGSGHEAVATINYQDIQ